ncbi:MAG: type II CAAX endopeptidase family protein [Clostridia bacterium]|nr:type II CAAX endopeptidase family protein [Clostridia bacterium]
MENTQGKNLKKYLVWVFAIGWTMQFVASYFARRGNLALFNGILAVSMFAPLVSAVLSGEKVRSVGWGFRLKGKLRHWLAAWFLPAVLGCLGAALFFLLFPKTLSTDLYYIRATLGEAGIAALEAQGMTVALYAGVSALSAVTYAPLLNMLFAVGEEAGWRGVMYPALKRRFGTVRGRIAGGVIWGAWHWPVMLLAGYEYGLRYFGAPVLGPMLFCVIACAMGVLLDRLYERTGSVWAAALGHGAINAFAGVPTLLCGPAYTAGMTIAGPLMIGAVGGIPLMATAVYILIKDAKTES